MNLLFWPQISTSRSRIFVFPKYNFVVHVFPFFEKIIDTVHVVGKASNSVEMKITIACLHTQFKPQVLPHDVDK